MRGWCGQLVEPRASCEKSNSYYEAMEIIANSMENRTRDMDSGKANTHLRSLGITTD